MTDPWRYSCPKGHQSWRPSGDRYVCDRCRENGHGKYFDELVDMKRENNANVENTL